MRLTILFVLFLTGTQCAEADMITLSSGKKYEGKIVNVDIDSLKFKTLDDRILRINFRMISSLEGSISSENSEYLGSVTDIINAQNLERVKRETAEELEFVRKIENKKVDFYMTSWCPYCRKMENFFRENGINYSKYDIEKDSAANKRYKQLGGQGVPLMKIGKNVVHGYNPAAVMSALKE